MLTLKELKALVSKWRKPKNKSALDELLRKYSPLVDNNHRFWIQTFSRFVFLHVDTRKGVATIVQVQPAKAPYVVETRLSATCADNRN